MINKNDVVFLTDFYEFTMAYTYFKEGKHEEIAYFDLFTRKVPDKGGYLIFNGLNKVIESINNFRFTSSHIEFLRDQGFDDPAFLDYLLNMNLELDVWGLPDGTICFPNEPLVTVRGTMIQAQLIETLLLLSVNYATLAATKASRIVSAAGGRAVLEFGARRAHSYDASLEGARAAIIGGCVATSNTLAGYKYGVKIGGTMAHSYIQSFDNEYDAFLEFAKINPNNSVFLVDTYDTLKSGVPNAIKVAKDYLLPNGYKLKAIRLDSGDLAYLSKQARIQLDEAGLTDTLIMASNSLDEYIIDDLIYQGAKIDQFGVGENLITSKSEPVLGGVYKLVALVEDDETIVPKIKISENIEKITNPGYKKLYRFYDKDTHKALADYIALSSEVVPTDQITIFDPKAPWKQKTLYNYVVKEMQVPIFDKGKLVYNEPSIEEIMVYAKEELTSFWDEMKRLQFPHKYYVDLSRELYDLKVNLLYELNKENNK